MAAGQPDITLTPPLSHFFPLLLGGATGVSLRQQHRVVYIFISEPLCDCLALFPHPRPNADVQCHSPEIGSVVGGAVPSGPAQG